MDAKRTRYADLIECSARVLAFDGLIDAALPDLVSAWTSEAIDLCNGWVSFAPDDNFGSAELPIVDAVIAEDALELRHVGEPRHIVEDERVLGEQARDHQGQGGVLGAGNRNGAVKRLTADDADAIHVDRKSVV